MSLDRREFLKITAAAGLGAGTAGCRRDRDSGYAALDLAASRPVLTLDGLPGPVTVESIDLLRSGREFFVRSRSTDGVEGISITNSRAAYLYPILKELVVPCFLGKDARDLESLVDSVYLYSSNYKIANLALWCPTAWVEFSLLDMLGKAAKKPVGELLGGIVRREVPVYIASGRRDTTPEEEADILVKMVEETGIRAVKFKVGGRMRNNADSLPGRTEGLIPLARKVLGDYVVIHADSNGSYDAVEAIRIGRMLEDIGAAFYEEPCPFDHLDETRQVADALDVPIAGGEQEPSFWRFRWMIGERAVRVVQPDLHYYGGFIRSARVAAMAAAAGMTVSLHISDGGVGYADMLHFASRTPNTYAFQEYKGGVETSGRWFDPPLKLRDGKVNVPSGPGLGITIDPALLRRAERI